MTKIVTVMIGLHLALASPGVFAVEPSASRYQECTHHKNQRTAAMQARDWSSMERFANTYINRCASVDSPRDLSKAHWEIAMAAMKIGRPASALKSFENCISVSYANAACHVDKIYLLIRMNRKSEARALYEGASRLVNSQLATVERELQGSVSGMEKESLEIDRETLQINQQSLAMYAEDL